MVEALTSRIAMVIFLGGAIAACTGNMGASQETAAGKQRLQAGVTLARSGIQQYQTGNGSGLESVDQGRGMMVQGMGMMGLNCCLADGGVAEVLDGGAVGGCASQMGPGGSMTLQGLAKFDGARPAMTSSNATAARNAMADMEAGMKIMEKGSSQMMNGESMGMM